MHYIFDSHYAVTVPRYQTDKELICECVKSSSVMQAMRETERERERADEAAKSNLLLL